MKFREERPFADIDAAVKQLLEIAMPLRLTTPVHSKSAPSTVNLKRPAEAMLNMARL
jgi:hypothetical protein